MNIDTNILSNGHHGTSKHSGLFDNEKTKKFLKNRSFDDDNNCRIKLYTRSHHRGKLITASKEKRILGAHSVKSLKVEGDCKWEILR